MASAGSVRKVGPIFSRPIALVIPAPVFRARKAVSKVSTRGHLGEEFFVRVESRSRSKLSRVRKVKLKWYPAIAHTSKDPHCKSICCFSPSSLHGWATPRTLTVLIPSSSARRIQEGYKSR